MNKVLLIAFLALAVLALSVESRRRWDYRNYLRNRSSGRQPWWMRRYGGRDGRRFGHRGRFNPGHPRGISLRDRFSDLEARRNRDRVAADRRERDRAAIRASRDRRNRLAAKNREAEQERLRLRKLEETDAEHHLDKGKKFRVVIEKKNHHKESTKFHHKKKNEIDTGSKRFKDQRLDKDEHDRTDLAALSESERDARLRAEQEADALTRGGFGGLLAGSNRNRLDARQRSRDRNALKLRKDRGSSLSARNRQAEQNHHREKNTEETKFEHTVDKGSSSRVVIEKDDHHKESKRLRHRKGSAIDAESKRLKDQRLLVDQHDKQDLEALSESERTERLRAEREAERLARSG